MGEARGATDHTRLSLAYRGLREPPLDDLIVYRGSLVELDLSNNKIADLRFLQELPRLETLVLDNNRVSAHVKMPVCKALQTFWVNHNRIENLGLFITTLARYCPNLRILSMMNNPAAPSYFNGGTYQQYMDYRYFVISSLPKLEVLDYSAVTPGEKSEAKRIYPMAIVLNRHKDKSRRKKHAPTTAA